MGKEDKDFVRVDDWIPYEGDKIIGHDGKLIVIPFDRIFGKRDIKTLNNFIIKKDSYVKRLDDCFKEGQEGKGICHYLNYFIKFYDKKNELILSYLKLKYIIDNKKNRSSLKAFINMLYCTLFTDDLKSKISEMVEDNYYVDLTSQHGNKYPESLEFTNDHGKLLMKISMSMKIMIPIVFHYINVNNMIKETTYIYQFYEELFSLYDEQTNIYTKLYVSTLSKVNVNLTKNRVLWEQREIFGTDPLLYTDILLKDKIISETMFKYTFDKNIINFNSVVLDKQLG